MHFEIYECSLKRWADDGSNFLLGLSHHKSQMRALWFNCYWAEDGLPSSWCWQNSREVYLGWFCHEGTCVQTQWCLVLFTTSYTSGWIVLITMWQCFSLCSLLVPLYSPVCVWPVDWWRPSSITSSGRRSVHLQPHTSLSPKLRVASCTA